MEFKYVKPLAKEDSIHAFFKLYGVSMPEKFERFFKDNNGSRPSLNTYVLKNGAEKVLNSFLSFNEGDRENVYKAKRRTMEDDVALIPFANDPAGNYFCLKESAVVFYSHEDGEEIGAADSFEEFLNKLQ